MKSFFYKRVDSTNLEAKRKLKVEGNNEDFWIIAKDQFKGRGHDRNLWESAPGENFTGSLVCFPEKLAAMQQFNLSKSICLGLADFLELYLLDVKIKWPNDLYVKDQKIAGILIENEIMGDHLSVSIMGIGMNINQSTFISDAPNPVSLSQLCGFRFDMHELTKLLCTCVEARLENLSKVSDISLDEEYLKKLYRYEEYAPYKYQDIWMEGRIIGIGEFGELIIEDKKGKSHSFGFKDVEFILP